MGGGLTHCGLVSWRDTSLIREDEGLHGDVEHDGDEGKWDLPSSPSCYVPMKTLIFRSGKYLSSSLGHNVVNPPGFTFISIMFHVP